MLSVTGLNKFYYIRNFTDMRCKYNRVLAVIRHQLGREPYALTFPHCLNRQPDYLWLQIKNGVRNE